MPHVELPQAEFKVSIEIVAIYSATALVAIGYKEYCTSFILCLNMILLLGGHAR
jgi:hypothetical protein